jgi:hypothetical protein
MNADGAPTGTEHFGPFTNIPSNDIHEAGFKCYTCRQSVRRFKAVVPHLLPRMVFYSCRCGSVAVWEDESQPASSKTWRFNMTLLAKAGVDIVIFNGGRETPAGFQGIN